MREASWSERLDAVLDWGGLVTSGMLLAVAVQDYRDGESLWWVVCMGGLVLVGLWVVARGVVRRRREARRQAAGVRW
ncbi:hypothetical protein [Streptomyces sp. enrichment culture]|uniref:hypothetical protein n=1 Tax=Streptomyces sp. enrichment culture TaxID=1795815 RepID=UPI003F547251